MRVVFTVAVALAFLFLLVAPASACPPVAPAQAFGGGFGAGYGGGFGAPVVVDPGYGVQANFGVGNYGVNAAFGAPAFGVGVATPLYGSGLGFSGVGYGGVPLLASRGGAVIVRRPGLFGRIRAARRGFFRGF